MSHLLRRVVMLKWISKILVVTVVKTGSQVGKLVHGEDKYSLVDGVIVRCTVTVQSECVGPSGDYELN
jgi:hypothetical protein